MEFHRQTCSSVAFPGRFPAETQGRLIDAVIDVIGAQSVFTTFAYRHAAPLLAARRFRALLADRFETVVPSRTVWRNLPPAFVLHARRPRAHTAR
jgi:phosphatidylethanolamine/phosphatidyl-N-methylethanolamine N-methyltransferase